MKRILSVLLATLLLVSLPAAFAEGNAQRYQGPGYITPEEALTAYVGAMSRSDLMGMLSVFALESFVEEADPARAHQAVSPRVLFSDATNIIVNDEYTRQLKLIQRISEITDVLYRQYIFFSVDDAQQFMMNIVDRRKEDKNAAYVALFSENHFAQIFSGCEVIEPLLLSDMPEYATNERVITNLAANCVLYGCDEIRPAGIWIRTPEEDYLLTAECCRYGDAWYILNLGGALSYALNIDFNACGLTTRTALQLSGHMD